MMAQPHREYILEVFADQTFVKDIVKGMAFLDGYIVRRWRSYMS